MSRSSRGRWLPGLLGFFVVCGSWILGPTGPADAIVARHHPVAGTYQVTISGVAQLTTVLSRDHTVTNPSGTWSVHKHVVTIQGTAGQASAFDCLRHGQPPFCNFSDVIGGPVTPTGIASPTSPGTANVYIGSALLLSSPFWAVRTGRA
ncbi:MAG: hypothetical protein ACRDU0_19535 [Mycobacterium sp.]